MGLRDLFSRGTPPATPTSPTPARKAYDKAQREAERWESSRSKRVARHRTEGTGTSRRVQKADDERRTAEYKLARGRRR